MHTKNPGYKQNNHLNNLSETDKAYVAGIIDGEGCISIHKMKKPNVNWYSLKVGVKSADKFMIPHLRNLFGLGSIQFYKRKETKHTDTIQITLSGNKAKNLLEQILPYLKVKYEQAYLGIIFQNLQNTTHSSNPKSEIKNTFFELMKELKVFLKIPKGLSKNAFA